VNGQVVNGRTLCRHDTFFIDEVLVKITGKQHYLGRAVDQDGEVVDVFLQARRGRLASWDTALQRTLL
jgi:transposase-like protein